MKTGEKNMGSNKIDNIDNKEGDYGEIGRSPFDSLKVNGNHKYRWRTSLSTLKLKWELKKRGRPKNRLFPFDGAGGL